MQKLAYQGPRLHKSFKLESVISPLTGLPASLLKNTIRIQSLPASVLYRFCTPTFLQKDIQSGFKNSGRELLQQKWRFLWPTKLLSTLLGGKPE